MDAAGNEFHTYINANAGRIHGERWRNEEKIASAFVESAVNEVVSKRMAKRQQMQWSKAWRTPAASDEDEGAERGPRSDIPSLVSEFSAGG